MKRTLFDPDHDAFRDSVREFVARSIVPHEEKLIEQRFVDREIWLEAGRNGYLGFRPVRPVRPNPVVVGAMCDGAAADDRSRVSR